MAKPARSPFSYPKYWAECFGTAPFLPMSREEMDQLGWDSCDVIIVCGDAYVDHPSFGMAVIGRYLESQGFRVGMICQPDWTSKDDFMRLGKPNLFYGVSAGNMDSLINRYTADLRPRSEDAYTPDGDPTKRPDRAVTVYSQRCKEAYSDVPVIIGGIEASLRRIAQYDYWTDKVRRSVLIDSTADILLYGNAERALGELAHHIAKGIPVSNLTNIRGTAVVRDATPKGWDEIDSTRIDWPGQIDKIPSPYEYIEDKETCASNKAEEQKAAEEAEEQVIKIVPMPLQRKVELDKDKTYVRLPSFEKVRSDSALYAHASRVLHQEANPFNARPLAQKHGNKEIWVNPPPIPLETEEIDGVFALPYQRRPHPSYGDARIPAYEMIKTSVNIMRGCFGGCTFCSITEHEGRIIQSRSEESILNEIEDIREKVPGFTGQISDLGGPTANMYRLTCKSQEILDNCRRLSCVYPGICKNLITDHKHTTQLYRKARALPGVKKVAIASGLRYDLAVRDPEYVKELVTHHVGGYLKIAPEHTEKKTLSLMMKPEMDTYDAFKRMFEKYSKEAGKKQYLIPYFIAAHPGCEDEDMMNLALWLKRNKFRADQVQTFYPSPMALATAMYHSDRNPLKKLSYKSKKLFTAKKFEQRRLHKAYLRYHDEKGWGYMRQSLLEMGRKDLIGDGPECLIPAEQKQRSTRGNRPAGRGTAKPAGRRSASNSRNAASRRAGAKSGSAKPSNSRAGSGRAKPSSRPGSRPSSSPSSSPKNKRR